MLSLKKEIRTGRVIRSFRNFMTPGQEEIVTVQGYLYVTDIEFSEVRNPRRSCGKSLPIQIALDQWENCPTGKNSASKGSVAYTF